MENRKVNRRQLLKSSVVSGTTLLASYELPAADNRETLSFILVSDTHLGRNDIESPERQWRAAIAEINELPGQFGLHLGDIVDRGEKRSIRFMVNLSNR